MTPGRLAEITSVRSSSPLSGSRLRRWVLAGVAVAVVVVRAAAPLGAIETSAFGLAAADPARDNRLHVTVRAGERTEGRLLVWNKLDEPITLALSVRAARVADSGATEIGGRSEAVSWVELPATVSLAAQEERIVRVVVDAPSTVSAGTKTLAVLAELTGEETSPAVLQRIGVTTFLEPDPDALSVESIPMWLVVAAVAVLLSVILLLVRVRRRGGRASDS